MQPPQLTPDYRVRLLAEFERVLMNAARLRDILGLSDAESRAGYFRATAILTGRVHPTAEEMRRIVDALDMTPGRRQMLVREYLTWCNFPELVKLAEVVVQPHGAL